MTHRMTRIFWKVVRFPLTRIVLALALVGGLVTVLQPRLQGMNRWLSTLILVVAADLAYRLFVRVIERRRTSELGFRRAAGELPSQQSSRLVSRHCQSEYAPLGEVPGEMNPDGQPEPLGDHVGCGQEHPGFQCDGDRADPSRARIACVQQAE